MIGSATWWFGGCAVFMVICMLFMMPWMMGHRGHGWMMGYGDHSGSEHAVDDAERTLANRLASGAIDSDEYERLRETLRPTKRSAAT